MAVSTDLELRLGYLDLGSADLERLAALQPMLEKHAAELVDSFYHHLLSFLPTRQLLGDAVVRERLVNLQRDYLISLADPIIDDAYIEQRRRIGETHERVGLEPRWYLGAYALYLSLLIPLVHEAHPHDPLEASRMIVALQKRLSLDAQIGMEVYIDHQQRQLQYSQFRGSKDRAPANRKPRAGRRRTRVGGHAGRRPRARDRHTDGCDPGARQSTRIRGF